MMIKLKPWDEVVRLGKKYGFYETLLDSCYNKVFGLDVRSLPWGYNVAATGPDSDGDYIVHDLFVKPWMIDIISDGCDNLSIDDAMRYGKVITDDQMYTINVDVDRRPVTGDVRIRLIAYEGNLYFHKMVNGYVVDCRCVGKVDA